MADFARTAKSGRDWTCFDSEAYHITICNQSPRHFFGYKPNGLPDNLDPNILTTQEPNDNLSDATYRLLQYITLAKTPSDSGQKSVPYDAIREVLHAVGFEERGNILRAYFPLPFLIAYDGDRYAEPDLCLTHDDLTILLIVEIQDQGSQHCDTEARAISAAIAAYRYNNAYRDEKGLHQLGSMTIPAITVYRTRPFFYKIHVTEDLSRDIAAGRYPTKEVIVHRCIVALPPEHPLYEGMECMEFRGEILMYYEAFRKMAKAYWEKYGLI
ncbi:hypothetical protein AN958_07426 [Leucoagaricus sp. SymC.cos]|nr:hypothetical protein AN958_07426 [Leucoagaricus sp. SymC.cos]